MADTQVDAGTEISAKVGTLPAHLPTCGNASFRTHCRRFTQVEPEAVDRSKGDGPADARRFFGLVIVHRLFVLFM